MYKEGNTSSMPSIRNDYEYAKTWPRDSGTPQNREVLKAHTTIASHSSNNFRINYNSVIEVPRL